MRTALGILVALLAAAPAEARSRQVIWSSLPLSGEGRRDGRDVRDGERLALEEAGGKAGGFEIVLRSRDDASRAAGAWDPPVVARNARRAALDDATVAYLGDFNSGATAISMRILDRFNIPQISPSSTYVGLTRSRGADPGEPGKYQRFGDRNFVRIAPADHLQAAAVAALLAQGGIHRVALGHDGESYGRGVGLLVADALRARGLELVLNARVVQRARNAATIARRAQAAGAEAFVFVGVAATGGAAVMRAVHRRAPAIPLIATDGCLDSAFTRHLGSTAARVLITGDAAPAEARGPAGQAFAQRFRARWKRSPRPYAVNGYEAMALALDAINRAAPADNVSRRRMNVAEALVGTRDRDSVLGRYSIDEQGDTTLSAYGVYGVRSKLPRFAFVVDSAG